MKIQVEHRPKELLNRFEKDVVKISVYDNSEKKRGEIIIYEYTNGEIESSIYYEVKHKRSYHKR